MIQDIEKWNARLEEIKLAAARVALEYRNQQRARFMAALMYGRFLRLLRDVGRRQLGREWADRIWDCVRGRKTTP